MRDTLVIALEASWEQDPVRMEDALWDTVDAGSQLEKADTCRKNVVSKTAKRLKYRHKSDVRK